MTLDPTFEPSLDTPPDRLPGDDTPSPDPTALSFGASATDNPMAPDGESRSLDAPSDLRSPSDDAAIPLLSPADAARDNARRGTWAMNEWYDGWVLLGGDGKPVMRSDRSRVGFRFADVARLADELTGQSDDPDAAADPRRTLAPLDSAFNKDWDPQRPKSTLADMTKWTRLLAYYHAQSTEQEEAVRRAVSMIFGNSVTLDERGTRLWVPTKYDAEAVKSVADMLLRQAAGPELTAAGDGQDLGKLGATPTADAIPTTRTIRGVPIDRWDIGLIKTTAVIAQGSNASGAAFGSPSRQQGDSRYSQIIRNITPQPPSKRSAEIDNVISHSPLTAAWRDWLAQRFETQGQPNDGYGTYQLDPKKKGDENKPEGFALGRYQMRRSALIDSGLMNRDGSATGKYGIQRWEDFLNNPDAQEAALVDWTRVLEKSFRNNHTGRVGKTIASASGPITVTKGGVIAAMHKQGTTGVIRYFKWLESMNWDSRNQNQMPKDLRTGFVSIETRLREFQNVQY